MGTLLTESNKAFSTQWRAHGGGSKHSVQHVIHLSDNVPLSHNFLSERKSKGHSVLAIFGLGLYQAFIYLDITAYIFPYVSLRQILFEKISLLAKQLDSQLSAQSN